MVQTIWPVKWMRDITSVDEELVDIAEQFAGAVMRMLTANRYGNVHVTVMPCSDRCVRPNITAGAPLLPYPSAGKLRGTCRCNGGCSCASAPSVYLDSPVGGIIEVKVDGVILPETSYRVDDGNWLVRTDGEGWPSCAGEDFTVTYVNSYKVSFLGEIAAGALAAEYLMLIDGDAKCQLPTGITSISRQGVNIEITSGMFPDGLTGIREVDTYLSMVNPYGLKTPPTIHSVDRKRNRQTTWRA